MSNLEPNNDLIKEPNVPRGTFLVLERFVSLLSKWNDKINLIGRRSANLIWQNHVLPSAQLIQYIEMAEPVILDVGSGAGFPGIILSIVKGWKVILVERSEKKCIFLREVRNITNANVEVETDEILSPSSSLCRGSSKKIIPRRGQFEETNKFSPDIIVSRGVTSIGNFLKLVDRFLNDKVKIMLMKGDRCQDEIDESLGKDWHFDYEIKHGQKDKGNTVVILSNFRKV